MEFDPDQEINSKTIETELNLCIDKLQESEESERIKLLKTYISLKFKLKNFQQDPKLGFELTN